MKLEAGKRYVMRDGRITGPLQRLDDSTYPFNDPNNGLTWGENGFYFWHREQANSDIVSEYVEDKPTRAATHDAQISPEAQKQAMEFWCNAFMYHTQTHGLQLLPERIAEIADRCLDEFKKRFMQ